MRLHSRWTKKTILKKEAKDGGEGAQDSPSDLLGTPRPLRAQLSRERGTNTPEGFYVARPRNIERTAHFKDVHSRKLAELLEAFHVLDFDRDDHINLDGLRKTFAPLRMSAEDEDLKQMLSGRGARLTVLKCLQASTPLNFDAFVVLLGCRTLDLDPEEVVLDALSNWDDHDVGLISYERSLDDLFITQNLHQIPKKTNIKMTTAVCKREISGMHKMADCEGGGHSKKTRGQDLDPRDEKGENGPELKLPDVIGITLNLSKKNLRDFPQALFEKMADVQHLYLEGNWLSLLPQDFFQRLPSLKWLDLRNNCLTALPTLSLRNHPSLQFILLQGNRIRDLPPELASIPSLRGVQVAGNPIANVPCEVIEGGFDEMMRYLREASAEDEILLPVPEMVLVKPSTSRGEADDPKDIQLRTWDLNKLSQWRQSTKTRPENGKDRTDKLISQQPKGKVPLRPFRCGTYNRSRHRATGSALRHLKMRRSRLGYKKKPVSLAMIQEKAVREAQRAQVRETLEKQARKIQRMRDKEVLKNWRDHARITRQQMKFLDNYQQYPSKDFTDKTPFDVDPEFLTMLSRVDLYRSLKDMDNRAKRSARPKPRITALDLDRQMNEIMKKLEQLNTDDSDNSSSPRSKRTHMCERMHKIMDIQKTLKSLQTVNSSMNGIVPVMKPKRKN